jgi:hypothetical protein
MTRYLFLGITSLLFLACTEKENPELQEAEGYIVGFDPCTINHHYRIGYVIISKDYLDTLVTYNLSDRVFTMPASVELKSSNPLYTIPEDRFSGYRDSAYFPELYRNDYPIKISYRKALDHELIINLCTADINMGDFSRQMMNNQIIVVKVSRN